MSSVRRRLMIDDPRSTCTMPVNITPFRPILFSFRESSTFRPRDLSIVPSFHNVYHDLSRSSIFFPCANEEYPIVRFLFNNFYKTDGTLSSRIMFSLPTRDNLTKRKNQPNSTCWNGSMRNTCCTQEPSVWKVVSRTGHCLKSQRDTDSFFSL